MQIRAQLRRTAFALTTTDEGTRCCGAETVEGCPNGYHGAHLRVRWKSKRKSHGNATWAGKGGQ